MNIALFIGYHLDWHLNEVRIFLRENYDILAFIIDPSHPMEIAFDPSSPNKINIEGAEYTIGCVWWRWKPYIDNDFRRSDSYESLQHLEWNSFLKSIWFLNDKVSVHNFKSAIMYNEKLSQSEIARESGFKIPNTICTNSKNVISSRLNEDNLIIKPLRVGSTTSKDGSSELLSTSILLPKHLDEISADSILNSASYIQELIDKDYEIRLNYIYGHIYARKFERGKINRLVGKDLIDWRLVYQLHNKISDFSEEVSIPKSLSDKILRYAQITSLNLLCFDLAVSDGNLFFLEANPDGQWGWLGDQENSVKIVADNINITMSKSITPPQLNT